jgi:thiamine biosynthesis lipoprotein ApbE
MEHEIKRANNKKAEALEVSDEMYALIEAIKDLTQEIRRLTR